MKSSLRLYHRVARLYDPVALVWEGIRRAGLAALDLRGGETVVDLACGTGLSFAGLEARVGPAGRLIAVDQSAAMQALADRRVRARGWRNVTLVRAGAAALPLRSGAADLVFCCLAHDVVADDAAMDEAVRVLRPGGRLVLAGVKLADGAAARLVNPLVRVSAGLALAAPLTLRPWAHAARLLGGMVVRPLRLGTAYVAAGRKAGRTRVSLPSTAFRP